MTKSEELYIRSQLAYYEGKCAAYERLLIKAGLIDEVVNDFGGSR